MSDHQATPTEIDFPSEANVDFFQQNGFWLGPVILSADQIDNLREHMERVWAGEYETGKPPWSTSWKPGDSPSALRKMDNSHWADLTIRDLALNPVIGKIAARLLRAKAIRLWHDQLLYKPGGGQTSGNVGWHQDYNYWQCADRPDLITAWVAFDDVNLENGCMQFVPRSNQWGILNENDFFNSDIEGAEKRMKIPQGEQFEKVPCILKAGAASFHHSMTLHGSGANTTAHPRRSLVIHMMADGVRYRAGTPSEEHMNVKLLAGSDGDPFEGPHFPVIYAGE